MAPCGRPIGGTRNDGCADQDEAVERVREDMMRLAEHVTQALHDAGLATSMHPRTVGPLGWERSSSVTFNRFSRAT